MIWFTTFLLSLTVAFVAANVSHVDCLEGCTCKLKDDSSLLLSVSCSALTYIKPDIASKIHDLRLFFESSNANDFERIPELPVLHRLSIIGTLPSDIIQSQSWHKKFPNLRILVLNKNDLETLLQHLPYDLKSLIVAENSLRKIGCSDFAQFCSLSELFLDGNKIEKITVNSFTDNNHSASQECGNGFGKLEVLSLERNAIESLEGSCFSSLSQLQALNLRSNMLKQLSVEVFAGLDSLRILDLSHNPITHLPDGIFAELNLLKHLNLSSCQLRAFPIDLPFLEVLDLFNNSIRTISSDSKFNIYPVEVLKLGSNPLHCDCNLAWLKELYIRREYLLKYINVATDEFLPTCASPHQLMGKRWDVLSEEMFQCSTPSNKVSSSDSTHQGNIELVVRLRQVADSSATVIWSLDSHRKPIAFFVIWYIFGQRKLLEHVEVSSDVKQYTVKRLKPVSNYVICVIPKMLESDVVSSSLTMNWCAEATTKEASITEDIGVVRIVLLYVVVMIGTVAGLLLAISLCAILCSWLRPAADSSDTDPCIVDEPLAAGSHHADLNVTRDPTVSNSKPKTE